MRTLLVAVLLAGGCGRGERQAKPITSSSPDGSGSGTTMPTRPTITAKLTATQPGRPPLMRLTVDVSIDNPGDAARWITIAKQIPPDDGVGGGVDGVDVRGSGAAVIGTFLGTGGFHAVRIAPHAKGKITNLPVGWWQSSADAPMPGLDVSIGDDLKIAGGPASAWFGVEPLLGDGATIDAAGDSQHDFRTDGAEVAIELVGGAASTIVLQP